MGSSNLLRSKAAEFVRFAYNKQTKQFFGRTCKSWAQIGSFFFVFYIVVGGIFAVHLAVFIGITPQPAEDVQPWNFGRYAYPNYPNSKIALISTPYTFSYNGSVASLTSKEQQRIEKLINSATESGVDSHCLRSDTQYGYATGEPCVFLHISQVFSWTPDLINTTLKDQPLLSLSCAPDSTDLGIEITATPNGIPLNLSNNIDVSNDHMYRSFPYRRQPDYILPVMGLIVNLTEAHPPPNQHRFDVTITCSVDYSALGMLKPSAEVLERLYEIPLDATAIIHFKL